MMSRVAADDIDGQNGQNDDAGIVQINQGPSESGAGDVKANVSVINWNIQAFGQLNPQMV